MQRTQKDKKNIYEEVTYIKKITDQALQKGFSIALWKLPHDNTKHLILSENIYHLEKPSLEELPQGFLFAPFQKERKKLFLQADYVFSFTDGKMNDPSNSIEDHSQAWLHDQLHRKPSSPYRSIGLLPPLVEAEQEKFTGLVKKAMEEISAGKYEKVVLSRAKKIDLPDRPDPIETFSLLSETYSNVLTSWVHIPEVGTWMGASPELLVEVENQQTFRTTALAGTQPFTPGMDIKAATWTQKEIEEQALVERYIISCFKKIRLREYEEHGPKTVIAGNLMHLRSDFSVDLKATNFPQLGSVMLHLLHPTSAVCGYPEEAAHAFILSHEGYDREFYAGYLGPVNHQDRSQIFVNLRCMQWLDQGAILYAGAGITADSEPLLEWNETEIKLNTLLNIIRASSNHI